jgi:hypothetical protein
MMACYCPYTGGCCATCPKNNGPFVPTYPWHYPVPEWPARDPYWTPPPEPRYKMTEETKRILKDLFDNMNKTKENNDG